MIGFDMPAVFTEQEMMDRFASPCYRADTDFRGYVECAMNYIGKLSRQIQFHENALMKETDELARIDHENLIMKYQHDIADCEMSYMQTMSCDDSQTLYFINIPDGKPGFEVVGRTSKKRHDDYMRDMTLHMYA